MNSYEGVSVTNSLSGKGVGKSERTRYPSRLWIGWTSSSDRVHEWDTVSDTIGVGDIPEEIPSNP